MGFSRADSLMAEDNLIELRFRLTDGTDVGPKKYSLAVTVANLKSELLQQWPKGCKVIYVF